MVKLSVLILSALIAYALAQEGGSGEGGGSDQANWVGTEPQVKGKKCGDVSKDDCVFIDEAIENCPDTCGKGGNEKPAQQQNQPQQNPAPKKKKGCFHGDDMVQTKEYGTIAMSRLAELRDAHVLTRNDQGELEYSPVRYWLHAQPGLSMKFYHLSTQSGHRLAITGEHLIYETDCNGGDGRAKYAKNVQLGRCLYVRDESGKLLESPVVEKSHDKMVGIYSPITTTGSIVVNNVLASCYNYYENEALQKFVYQYMIGMQELLASWLPTSLYQAAFNAQNAAAVQVPRLILDFLQLSNVFVH